MKTGSSDEVGRLLQDIDELRNRMMSLPVSEFQRLGGIGSAFGTRPFLLNSPEIPTAPPSPLTPPIQLTSGYGPVQPLDLRLLPGVRLEDVILNGYASQLYGFLQATDSSQLDLIARNVQTLLLSATALRNQIIVTAPPIFGGPGIAIVLLLILLLLCLISSALVSLVDNIRDIVRAGNYDGALEKLDEVEDKVSDLNATVTRLLEASADASTISTAYVLLDSNKRMNLTAVTDIVKKLEQEPDNQRKGMLRDVAQTLANNVEQQIGSLSLLAKNDAQRAEVARERSELDQLRQRIRNG